MYKFKFMLNKKIFFISAICFIYFSMNKCAYVDEVHLMEGDLGKLEEAKTKESKQYEIVKKTCLQRLYLLEQNKDVNLDEPILIGKEKIYPTFFLIEIKPFNDELFEKLILNGADKNLKIKEYAEKRTLFAKACTYGNSKAIEILLQSRPDIKLEASLTKAIGSSFTHGYSKLSMCKMLLEYGADPNFISKAAFSQCPLISAIFKISDYKESSNKEYGLKQLNMYIEIIKLLLEYGADPFLIVRKEEDMVRTAWKFRSAYEYAKEIEMEEVIKIFDEHKIKMKIQKIDRNILRICRLLTN